MPLKRTESAIRVLLSTVDAASKIIGMMGRGRGQRLDKPSGVSAKASAAKEQFATIWPRDGLCPLCGRELVPGDSVNDHHLVPRSKGGKQKYALHKVCHSKIHAVFSEAELALVYNTFAALKAHEQIRRFIIWVRKQPPERINRNRRPKSKLKPQH